MYLMCTSCKFYIH